MRISLDRKMIESLRRMSDEGLWRLFWGLTSMSKGDFSRRNPDYKTLRRIRAVLDAAEDEDIERINRLLDIYHGSGV